MRASRAAGVKDENIERVIRHVTIIRKITTWAGNRPETDFRRKNTREIQTNHHNYIGMSLRVFS